MAPRQHRVDIHRQPRTKFSAVVKFYELRVGRRIGTRLMGLADIWAKLESELARLEGDTSELARAKKIVLLNARREAASEFADIAESQGRHGVATEFRETAYDAFQRLVALSS